MVRLLIGVIGGLSLSKWIESKQENKLVSIGSEILLFFVLYKLLRRK